MDVEEWTALDHVPEPAVRRAAGRWLRPEELAWCAAQPSLRRALVAVLCCKEAAYKAWAAAGPVHEVALALSGRPESGSAIREVAGPATVEVLWRDVGRRVLAVALATSLQGSDSAGPALYP